MIATSSVLRYALIGNPTARSGRGKRAWRKIRQQLDAVNASYVFCQSQYHGHAVELTAEQVTLGTDVVVAVGGDGTISEVLAGLMRGEAPSGRRPALGILYTGTSPDVCRYHRIPLDLEQAIRTLLSDHRRVVDIGEIRYCSAAPSTSSTDMDALSWFLCSVNLGIGASVAQGSNGGLRRYLGDGLGTLVSLFKTVVKHTPFDITCTVDGEGLRLTQVLNLTIGKNPYIASGIRLGVPIEPDDGTLYLFAARGFTLWGFLARLPMLYRGTFQDHPNNYSCKLKSFSSPLLRDAPAVEFDGDPRGFLPCAIRVLPKALTLVVPVPTSSDGDAE